MGKVLITLLAIGAALLWTGFNLTSIKAGLTAMSSDNARSMTGQSDDWG